jgi:hypothetical protein
MKATLQTELYQDFIVVDVNRNEIVYLFSSISLTSLHFSAHAGHLQVNTTVS